MNGVLVLGERTRKRLVAPLEALDYAVLAMAHATSVDAIAAALLELKRSATGAIGAIAVGAPATVLLEAATVLPQLDAIVLFGASLPRPPPHYDRMRAQIQIHRAERGRAMSSEDLDELRREAAPAHVLILDWGYETDNDRFIVEPARPERDDATIAWDRTRDFLTMAMP